MITSTQSKVYSAAKIGAARVFGEDSAAVITVALDVAEKGRFDADTKSIEAWAIEEGETRARKAFVESKRLSAMEGVPELLGKIPDVFHSFTDSELKFWNMMYVKNMPLESLADLYDLSIDEVLHVWAGLQNKVYSHIHAVKEG